MAKDQKSKKKKKSGNSAQVYMMLICLVLLSAVFLSTAVIFYIGLIPAFVAFFVDQSKRKSKAVTVMAFNFIGCLPFVGQLWSGDSSLSLALQIILDPIALVVIYAAAGFGYIVDWIAANAAANFLYKQGVSRQKAIAKRKEELVKRWGPDVRGDNPEAVIGVLEEDEGDQEEEDKKNTE